MALNKFDKSGGLNPQQQEAIRHIYETTHSALVNYAQSVLGRSVDFGVVEDLVEDTFMAVQGRIDTEGILRDRHGKQVASHLAYAKTTLRNVHIAWLEKQGRFVQLDPAVSENEDRNYRTPLEILNRETVKTFFATDPVSGRLTSNPTFANFITKICPPDVRNIFIRHVLEGCSLQQVSEATGMPINYCQYAVKAARGKLRFLLKQELKRGQ